MVIPVPPFIQSVDYKCRTLRTKKSTNTRLKHRIIFRRQLTFFCLQDTRKSAISRKRQRGKRLGVGLLTKSFMDKMNKSVGITDLKPKIKNGVPQTLHSFISIYCTSQMQFNPHKSPLLISSEAAHPPEDNHYNFQSDHYIN